MSTEKIEVLQPVHLTVSTSADQIHAMSTFLEFFAGGGMARAGLGPSWKCLWANDFSAEKAETYCRNWGREEFQLGDVAKVHAATIPNAFLAWASFPCQDLSLAGDQSGIGRRSDLSPTRSGTFWPFWKLMDLKRPPVVVLENVVGTLTSRGGADFAAICSAVCKADYSLGALVMDTVRWLPQSRARLFIVAVRRDIDLPPLLVGNGPDSLWHPPSVQRAYASLSGSARSRWVWWNLPEPNVTPPRLEDLINNERDEWVGWDTKKQTDYLLSLMSARNRTKVSESKKLGRRIVGTAYRRTREGKQRAEVRFDGIAGCLRTAGGGSSKQIVIEVQGDKVRSRLMSPREAARLQGLPDSYWLPNSYNDAYDLVGDGLSVPVVAHLRSSVLDVLGQIEKRRAIA